MKKSIGLLTLGSLVLIAGVALVNPSAGIVEDTLDAANNIGVSLKAANIGNNETVSVSRTYVQYGSEGTRQFVRFATAVSGPVKSIKYTRVIEGLGTKEKEVTSVYKGITSEGSVYYYDGTDVVSTPSEATDNYYWACYTIEFTTDTYKAADITAYITVESEKEGYEVVTSTPKTESFENLKQQAESTVYLYNQEDFKSFKEDVAKPNYNGKTVVLMSDITIDAIVVVAEGNDFVLDLNGHTINVAYATNSTTNHIYAFENHGTMKIKGEGTINARGIFNYGDLTLEEATINAIDCNGGYAVRSYAGATLTMNSGRIATTYEDDYLVDKGGYDATTVRVDEGATFVMNDGVIENISDFTFAIESMGTVVVNGGTISSVHSTVSSYGNLTINGGTFTCNGVEGVTAHALVAWDGSVSNIYGGTFDGKDNYNGFNIDACAGSVVNVYGGEFLNVHSGSLYGEGTINVEGGIFFDDPTSRLVSGHVAIKNAEGKWVVTEVSDSEYLLDRLTRGKTVVLTEDLLLETVVEIPENVKATLDLNGHSINVVYSAGSTTNHIYAFKNYGSLTIKGEGSINARGIYNYGDIVVDGATINAIDGNGGYAVNNYSGASLTLNSGTIATTYEDDFKVSEGGYDATTIKVARGATFTMNGGTVNNVCDFTAAIETAGTVIINDGFISSIHTTIYSTSDSVEINGGKIVCNGLEGVTQHTLYVYSGKMVVNGGEFVNTATDQTSTGGSVANGNIEINGGSFTGSIHDYQAKPTIKGGTFTSNPSKFLAEGYVATQNDEGKWVVSEYSVAATNYSELKELLKTEKEILIDGMITLEGDLSASNVRLYATKPNSGIDFNSFNISGTGTIEYENLYLKTKTKSVSSSDIPANSFYGGIDYLGHSTANYTNCTIEGVFTTYSNVINAKGCTFKSYVENGEEYYNVFAYSGGVFNFDECTFYYRDRALKVYSEGRNTYELNISNSSFVATEDYSVNKALINVDDTYIESCVINLTNITIDEKLSSARICSFSNADKVIVNQK